MKMFRFMSHIKNQNDEFHFLHALNISAHVVLFLRTLRQTKLKGKPNACTIKYYSIKTESITLYIYIYFH